MCKKGDIVARIVTTVTHYGFGTGKEPTKSHSIEIIRVAAATRDGAVAKYQTCDGSPIYKHYDRIGRVKFMMIGGEMQPRALRLFNTATDAESLRFDNQEEAKTAIEAA